MCGERCGSWGRVVCGLWMRLLVCESGVINMNFFDDKIINAAFLIKY